MAKKTWKEKLEASKEPVVKEAPMNFAGVRKGQAMLIPTPKLIDTYLRAVEEGDGRDVADMRRDLAKQFGAEATCPVTTGIHLRTVAEVAFEQLDGGADPATVAPVWRVIDKTTSTRKKVSFDPEVLSQLRKREGLDP